MVYPESVSGVAEPGEFSGLLISAAPRVDPAEILQPAEVLGTVNRILGCLSLERVPKNSDAPHRANAPDY